MHNFVVYLKKERLPNREQWQTVASDHKIPLVFSEDFNPHTHPLCDSAQVNHPEGSVTTRIGAATCIYQLDIRKFQSDELVFESQREATKDCDLSFCYRWQEKNAANSLAVNLSAATLAIAADGVIYWDRADGGMCRGPDAFKALTAKAWRRVKYPGRKLSKQDPFGPPLDPVMNIDNRFDFSCPRCDAPFNLDSHTFDGEKHTMCGQLIISPTNNR